MSWKGQSLLFCLLPTINLVLHCFVHDWAERCELCHLARNWGAFRLLRSLEKMLVIVYLGITVVN
jgi:hypothetical protein